MAHAVEHDLRDRAATVSGFEAGFVIDRLGQAQLGAAAIEIASSGLERAGPNGSGRSLNGSAH